MVSEGSSVIGSISDHWKAWEELGVSETVLSWVRDGIQFFPKSPAQLKSLIRQDNIIKGLDQSLWMDKEIDRMTNCGILSLVSTGEQRPQEINFTIPMHLVNKPGPKRYRLVVDCRMLNSGLPDRTFKMETIKTALQLTEKNWWMFSWDLEQGYYQLKIHPNSRKWLGVYWKGKWLVFNVLPLGVSLSPWLFSKVMKQVLKVWRKKGIRVVGYIDDFLVMARTKEECLHHRLIIDTMMKQLGMRREPSKGHWEPTQQAKFLGLILDTKLGLLIVPQEKITVVKELMLEVLQERRTSRRMLAKIAGKLLSFSLAFAPARIYTRSLYKLIDAFHIDKFSWNKKVNLTAQVTQDLTWLVENLVKFNGKAAWIPSHVIRVRTDASQTGWGAECLSRMARGPWTAAWMSRGANNTIARKEMMAVYLALKTFFPLLAGKLIRLEVDNSVVLSYLRNGGGHLEDMTDIVRKIWKILIVNNITIANSEWIPSQTNVEADLMSRVIDYGDWEISKETFQRITAQFGPFSIDRFANHLNKKAERFNAWHACPGVETVDAFTTLWTGEHNWLVPPFGLIQRTLKHLQESKAGGVIIIPVWPSQPWWPMLMDMSISYVEILSNSFIPGPSGKVEPWNNKNWTFRAVLLHAIVN
jgi:hypothetical protein